ncbi:MAG TPA: CRISPR-associated endonuclease Cas2 [Spirochaetota bacterium]|jgi:CRISPR/Cas system-associated endoribonuclease Cas2|nr:CRISPR-associated endonuclease Cas2 [Spirochaetota bacterium]HOQ12135.1 CRISPR-associated endonuclease Cas2 [Spirochaetota bacterium]HOV07779.1 CRISPR-associated endonuclease Cas2 [Spirochaetota bacterium]
MLTVVSYDIVSDSRRQKLAKLLEGFVSLPR